VGDVTAVGAGVTGLAVGDRVAAMPTRGGMATVVDLPAGEVYKIRGDLDVTRAVSGVLTGVTAYQLVHRAAHVGAGAVVVVHGAAGGTGALVAALARLAGAATVYGTCSSRNAAAVAAAGITPIDYAGTVAWDAAIRADMTTRGIAGADAVFDHVMTGGYTGRGVALLRRGGRYVAYGLTSKSSPGEFSTGAAIGAMSRLWVQGAINSWFDGRLAEFYNITRRRDAHPADFAADLATVMDLIAAGSLRPTDDGRVWDFEGARDALLSIAAGTHRGKQVIRMAPAVGAAGGGEGAAAAPAAAAAAAGGAGSSS